MIEAEQAKIYNYNNTRLKLLKTNAAILFNKICKTKQVIMVLTRAGIDVLM